MLSQHLVLIIPQAIDKAFSGLLISSFFLSACVLTVTSTPLLAQGLPGLENLAPTILDNSPYTVIEERDHDPSIFTQGFDYENDIFYESSGLFGKSFVRSYKDIAIKYDSIIIKDKPSTLTTPEKYIQDKSQRSKQRKYTAQQLSQYRLPKKFFAEGIVKIDNRLHLLTWRSGHLLSLDIHTLDLIDTRRYSGEGWGITYDGNDFIMSNGSDKLFFRDTDSFKIKRHVVVSDGQRRYEKLNELEFANGFVWANVWLSNYILKIDPTTGRVVERFDLSALAKKNMRHPMHTVLNGIAYDDKNRAFWVTGKYWPRKYLVKF